MPQTSSLSAVETTQPSRPWFLDALRIEGANVFLDPFGLRRGSPCSAWGSPPSAAGSGHSPTSLPRRPFARASPRAAARHRRSRTARRPRARCHRAARPRSGARCGRGAAGWAVSAGSAGGSAREDLPNRLRCKASAGRTGV